MKNLPRQKSPGPDGIAPVLLKELADQLSPLIAFTINRVLTEGVIPPQWKTGIVTPVPKEANPQEPGKFRPITLLNSMTRVFEKHMLRLLWPYLQTDSRQFGFKPKSGCQDALMRLQLDVIQLQESSQHSVQVAIVLLDTAKAFDALPTRTMISALERQGLPQRLLNITESWLTDREMRVRVNGQLSDPFIATSGTPQGSILAPYLFNASYDALHQVPRPTSIRLNMYADDLAVIGRVHSKADWANLQEYIFALEARLEVLGLRLNANKSQLMMVRLKSKDLDCPFKLHLSSGQEVPYCRKPRYLGVQLDEDLSFNEHWQREAGKMKGIAASYHAGVRGNRHLLYLALKSILEGKLHFALPYVPPRNKAVLEKIRMSMSYAGRLLLNEWKRKPAEAGEDPKCAPYLLNASQVLAKAKLADPTCLRRLQGMRFLYNCTTKGRQYGIWLDAEERQLGPRTRSLTQRRSNFPTTLKIPQTRLHTLSALQPIAMIAQWNALPWPDGEELEAAFANLKSFTEALEAMLTAA